MELTSVLPDIGTPVPTDILHLDKLADASPGEYFHAALQLVKLGVEKMADPANYHEIPTFVTGAGSDWNGYNPATAENADGGTVETTAGKGEVPTPPERYYDSLPGLGIMLGHLENLNDAANTVYASQVKEAMATQVRYLGTPYEGSPFQNAQQYLRQTRRWSGLKTKKHLQRAEVLTHTPGGDPEVASTYPTYPNVAESYTQGRLSSEIADRIITMRNDLNQYAADSKVPPGLVDQVMAAFDWKLAETGESVTPEEFTEFKKDRMDQIAHALDADGPSPSQVQRTPPDNAIKTKRFPQGGGRIWMDATPDVFNQFKNFMLHMLNGNGTPPTIPEDIANFIRPDGTNPEGEQTQDEETAAAADTLPDNLDDWPSPATDDQTMGEDSYGDAYTGEDIDDIEPMSSGQKVAALLIGMFRNLLRMDPTEVGIKKSHGSSAQLVIVQDIQTAYESLGIPPLPPDVQRPPGLAGVSFPKVKRPNPDVSDHPPPETRHDPDDPLEQRRKKWVNTYSWTSYQSHALNIGSMHPADAEMLSCDSELAGHIWNGPDEVLNQKRVHRLFTPKQRRAILARDRGCQAPGCTIPAVFSEIHHIKEWLAGGDTSVANAVTLCAHHHAAVHIGKWRIHNIDGQLYFQAAPWLDPYQPLLRNLYWNQQ